jgi:hypothetical protein
MIFILTLSILAIGQDCCKEPDKLSTLAQDLACQELPIGPELVVNQSDLQSPSEIERRFSIERKDKNRYLAKVQLKFIPDDDFDLAEKDPLKVDKMYQEIVGECLEYAAPYLSGPKGESLKIELSNDPDVPASNNQRLRTQYQ